jgi:hypothetical protein
MCMCVYIYNVGSLHSDMEIALNRKSSICGAVDDSWRMTSPFWSHLLHVAFNLSLYIQICMYVCLSACLPACLSLCLYACLPVCLYACLSVRLPAWLAGCLSVCMYVSRGQMPGVCLWIPFRLLKLNGWMRLDWIKLVINWVNREKR